MIKIISWNINGIRAIDRKGELRKFLLQEKPDILCLQEIKVQEKDIPQFFKDLSDYYCYYSFGQRKGYAGVAVLSKIKPQKVADKIGLSRFDQEGRVLSLRFKDFILFNFYIPNGARDKKDMGYKLEAYDFLLNDFLPKQKRTAPLILAGDFNVAHTEKDIARPKENANNTGFTLPERQKITALIERGFVDSFREFEQQGGHYTYWANFANARARNIGWRIDYFFLSKRLRTNLQRAFIMPKIMGSDHCPVGIDIKF